MIHTFESMTVLPYLNLYLPSECIPRNLLDEELS